MAPLARIQCTAALVSSPPENAMPTLSPFGNFPRMFTGRMISDPARAARMRRVRALATFIATVSVTQAFAAPFGVQLGDTKLALDTPPGFTDVQATGSPRLPELGGQPLTLALYTSQSGPEDVDWLRAATLRWIQELQQLNLR